MLRIFAKKRSIFILRCKVLDFGGFVIRHIFLVCTDDCAFKLVTCGFSDRVRNVVADSVGIGAAGHGDKQAICLDQLDFVDCEAIVNRYGGYCAELTAVKCFSEYDVCDVHFGVSFLFQLVVMLMFEMSA